MISSKTLLATAIMTLCIDAAALAGNSTTPTPRNVEHDWMSIADWYRQHADDVEVAAKGEARLLVVGDSIAQGWEFSPSWRERLSIYKPANLSIGGDKTQNLLWRLQNGGVGKLQPEAIVMLIGVNNFGHDNDSPEAVFEGIKANLDFLKKTFPDAKILTLSIFPWGEKADDPNRARAREANQMVETLADEQVTVLDIGEVFLEDDGSISKEIMADFLHPTAAGYERATAAILPTLGDWLGEK